MSISSQHIKKFVSVISVSFTVAYLSGCATPAEVDSKTQFTPSSPYYKNLIVSSVTGGSETHPLWKSKVS